MPTIPHASIVVPAHNEAGVIGRCLTSLTGDGRLDDVEVVVVANGCTDDTADVARAFHDRIGHLTVVERDSPGKVGALNEGDQHATAFPRIYLDADIELQQGALGSLVSTLSTSQPRVAAPRVDFRTDACRRSVRRFYDVFRNLPYAQGNLVGLGVYGLSEAGRRRFTTFPEVIADDLFVQRLFEPAERVVTDRAFHVFAPRDLASLLAVRTRVARGNAELARTEHVGPAHAMAPTTGSTSQALLQMLRNPRQIPSVCVYVGVTLAARRRAKRATMAWLRDDSSREAVPPGPPGPAVDPVSDGTATSVVVDGVAIDRLTEDETVAHMMHEQRLGVGGLIVTPNVDILRQVRRGHSDVMDAATVVVADGMPLVWASKVLGKPLPARVTGADLVWSLSRAASRSGLSVYLLGGAPGVGDRAATALAAANPGLKVAGTLSPPMGFERDLETLASVVETVRAAEPDLVFVAMGFPKQERLAITLREHLPRAWFLGCGGALDMAAGDVARAGARAQQLGVEWVHRLTQEPRRMARRYLVDDVPYACGLLVRSAARRLRQA